MTACHTRPRRRDWWGPLPSYGRPVPATPEDLFAFLDSLGIAHSTVTHPPFFTVEEGRPWHDKIPGLHCKNLFIKDKKGASVLKGGVPSRILPKARAPEGEAALPQLVAHGFVNLRAKLVSALRAPDGGDLRWLGASEHTKDFMHFELKKRPPLE